MLKKAFHLTYQSFLPILRPSAGVMIPLWILSNLIEQYFGYASKMAPQGSIESLFALLGKSSTAITVSFVLILLIPIRLDDWRRQQPYQAWTQIVSKYASPLMVEGLRMTGNILMWSILFLIPGLYKQIKYLFVPFVVLFDSQYHSGKVDALKRSSQLTSGLFWILSLLVFISFSLDLGFELASKVMPILAHPVCQFFSAGVQLLLSSFLYSVFYFLFILKMQESHENGAEIPR